MAKEPNPYEVLELSTRASLEDALSKSQLLAKEYPDRAAEFRRAAEAIRQHPVRRAVHQFWEPPGTNYEDEAVEAFCRRYAKNPFDRRWLRDRRRKFVSHDCAPERIARFVLPPCCVPPVFHQPRLRYVPEEPS